MYRFTIKDMTTGTTKHSNGTDAAIDRTWVKAFIDPSDHDSLQITANTSSDIWVLTGSGNDTLDLSHATGMEFVNAGSGINTIGLGSGIANISIESTATAPNTQPFTLDTIANFHAGDNLTFSGVTNIMEFTRGDKLCVTAWNAAVPGSAVNANLIGVASSALSMSQMGYSITLHA